MTETKTIGILWLAGAVGAIFAFLGWQDGQMEQVYFGLGLVATSAIASAVVIIKTTFEDEGSSWDWHEFLTEAKEAYAWARDHSEHTGAVLDKMRPLFQMSAKYHKIDDEDVDKTIDVLQKL